MRGRWVGAGNTVIGYMKGQLRARDVDGKRQMYTGRGYDFSNKNMQVQTDHEQLLLRIFNYGRMSGYEFLDVEDILWLGWFGVGIQAGLLFATAEWVPR